MHCEEGSAQLRRILLIEAICYQRTEEIVKVCDVIGLLRSGSVCSFSAPLHHPDSAKECCFLPA